MAETASRTPQAAEDPAEEKICNNNNGFSGRLSSKNEAEIRQAVKDRSGNFRITCVNPGCSGSQDNTLSIDAETGAYQCFRCGAKGNIFHQDNPGNGDKKPMPEFLWEKATPCTEHPYLSAKGVKSYGLRKDLHGNLLIPLSQNGYISTIQFISESGEKRLLSKEKGGRKKGASFQVGTGTGDVIYFGEGYATVASIYEATGAPCFMCVDAGNLRPAAEILRRRYPKARFIFCADNDRAKKPTDPGYDAGYIKAVEAARAVGGLVCMPEQPGYDFNDLHQQYGLESVREALEQAAEPEESPAADQGPKESEAEKAAWAYARRLIPRTPYPWAILPSEITESLKKLARACATTPAPLPGFACAMIGAAVGRKVNISPKLAWDEPIIIWPIDVKSTGEGKTAPMRAMAGVFFQEQRKAQEIADQERAEYEATPKMDRGEAPPGARGYYVTDLTLEGLRTELEKHPTGGIIAILNEASALINTQNQYKQKGTDRESMLKLHDGDDVRVVRAKQSILIKNARFQAMGGIQPAIFKKVFGGDDGQYLADGTVYRCLFTYDPATHYPLTLESWDSAYREAWENTLKNAMQWADSAEQPHTIRLDGEAQDLFLKWRNDLDRQKRNLPQEIRGFLPKTYGHALRLAGALDLIYQFNTGDTPRQLLDAEGMERGIKAAMFYLGQAVDIIRLIMGEELTAAPIKTRILEALQERGEMTATEINNDVFQRNQSADKIQAALNELIEAGQVKATTEPTGGRKKTKYTLNEKNEKTKKAPDGDGSTDLNSFNSYAPDFGQAPDTDLNSLNSFNSYGGENENDDEVII